MFANQTDEHFLSILHELCSFPAETEWVEFKHNKAHPEEIGEYISALANAAALLGKPSAYLVWGVDDATHAVIGTTFNPHATKVGNEALENWLLRHLTPKIDFIFHALSLNNLSVILLEIQAASHHPTQFQQVEYTRDL